MTPATSGNLPPVEAPILTKLKQTVEEVWQIEGLCRTPTGEPRPYPLYNLTGPVADPVQHSQFNDWLSQTLATLLDEVDGRVIELSRQAALLYFRPFGWIAPYTYDYTLPEIERFEAAARGGIMVAVLAQWLKLHPTTATRALLAERVGTLLRSAGAKWPPDLYHPTLEDCLILLLADGSDEATSMLGQLAAGEMGIPRRGSLEEPELRRVAPAIYRRLWEAEQFDYTIFRHAMFTLPGAFHDLSRPMDQNPAFYRDLPAGFSLQIQSFALQLTTSLAEQLPVGDPKVAALLKRVGYLEGASWLLLACAYVEEKGLTQLPPLRSKEPAAAATRLCRTHRPPIQPEDNAHILEFLDHYKAATLQAVLSHAPAYRKLISHVLAQKEAPSNEP